MHVACVLCGKCRGRNRRLLLLVAPPLMASAETPHSTSSWSAPSPRPIHRNANPAPARPRRPPERAPAPPPSSGPWQTTRPPAAARRQVRRCLACTSRCKACGRTGGTVIRHSSRKHSRICFTVAPRPAKRRKPGSNRSLPAPQALFEHTRQPPRRTQRIERSPPSGPSSSVPAAQSAIFLAAMQKAYPVPWAPQDMDATWLGNRLLLFPYILQPSINFTNVCGWTARSSSFKRHTIPVGTTKPNAF